MDFCIILLNWQLCNILETQWNDIYIFIPAPKGTYLCLKLSGMVCSFFGGMCIGGIEGTSILFTICSWPAKTPPECNTKYRWDLGNTGTLYYLLLYKISFIVCAGINMCTFFNRWHCAIKMFNINNKINHPSNQPPVHL